MSLSLLTFPDVCHDNQLGCHIADLSPLVSALAPGNFQCLFTPPIIPIKGLQAQALLDDCSSIPDIHVGAARIGF